MTLLHNLRIAGCFILLFATAYSCSENRPAPPSKLYMQRLTTFRKMKNDYFAKSPESPIPSKNRTTFSELPYFSANTDFIFALKLHKIEKPDTVEILTTDGQTQKMLKYGYFEFSAAGRQNRLTAFRFINDSGKLRPSLFIPFLDQTNGSLSYGGGRYLDLKMQHNEIYSVDFNYAYNPSCAYGNSNYSCPVPPEENTLRIAITAGEKAWATSQY